ncbi:MAG: hypothetical protein NTW11_01945 [Candidatus Staskawiczbacteria bacterium]|nr:hypothetical protein [Candidatus Staskawiczbacteria bacterium]
MIFNYRELLVILGVTINIIGTLPYLFGVIGGHVKPNKVSWLLWGMGPMIAGSAALVSGVGWSALPVFFSGIIPVSIFFVSLFVKRAYWKLESFDYWCGFFSLVALVSWGITKDPVLAIIFALIGDIFASVPTIKKAWVYPETESSLTYIAGAFSALTSLATITAWNFSSYAFPIYLFLVGCIIFIGLERKNFVVKKK